MISINWAFWRDGNYDVGVGAEVEPGNSHAFPWSTSGAVDCINTGRYLERVQLSKSQWHSQVTAISS